MSCNANVGSVSRYAQLPVFVSFTLVQFEHQQLTETNAASVGSIKPRLWAPAQVIIDLWHNSFTNVLVSEVVTWMCQEFIHI